MVNAREMAPGDARELSRLFFGRLRVLEEGTREYQYARNTLIEMNLSLVQFAARRFRARAFGGGIDMDDIVQVGTIGLIKAIDRYDPEREVEFSTLALPYITGEIKRHFRDTTWAVHVPRRLQELRTELAKAQESLTDVLGRAPTVKEIAQHLELPEEEIIEGLVAANGYTSGSLDTAGSEGDNQSTSSRGTRPLAEKIGDNDPAMELFEEFHTLAPLLEKLDERDLLILRMRFGEEKTQAEIGAELGISQMQVSRILSRTLTRLRAGMLSGV
ncbi:sigma factor [Streptomyces sp. Mg1]|nr:sigma factor [Streptomyces sp. Mg1]